MDILTFIEGATWEIVELCVDGDGAPLNLTGCTLELAIWNERGAGGIYTGAAVGSPTLGKAGYNITPTEQTDGNLVGFAGYYFSCRVTTGSGAISYQNNGLLFVASNPWPA